MQGPQESKQVSREKADQDIKMDTHAEAPCFKLTLARSLLVIGWRGPRSQPAAQPTSYCFLATRLESASCRTYMFNNPKHFA